MSLAVNPIDVGPPTVLLLYCTAASKKYLTKRQIFSVIFSIPSVILSRIFIQTGYFIAT